MSFVRTTKQTTGNHENGKQEKKKERAKAWIKKATPGGRER